MSGMPRNRVTASAPPRFLPGTEYTGRAQLTPLTQRCAFSKSAQSGIVVYALTSGLHMGELEQLRGGERIRQRVVARVDANAEMADPVVQRTIAARQRRIQPGHHIGQIQPGMPEGEPR